MNWFSQHSLPSSGLIGNGMDPERCDVNTGCCGMFFTLECQRKVLEMLTCFVVQHFFFFYISTGGYLNKYYITTCSYVNVYS